MKKRILVLATGGTIASTPSENGLMPALSIDDILKSSAILNDSYEITARDILHLDSSNIQPEEWILMARSIYAGVP